MIEIQNISLIPENVLNIVIYTIQKFAWKCAVSLVYCIAAIASSINTIDGVLLNVLHVYVTDKINK